MSEDPDKTLEELEEARAEEEFIAAPEDRVNNPLVPTASGTMISSGDFAHGDFTGGSDLINNETNMKGEIVENPDKAKSIFDKPEAAAAPAEEGAPLLGGKKKEKAAPAPAPVAEPAPAAAPAGVAPAPKKKSKAGLIVAICILAALLIGGGVFCLFFFVLRGTPANLVGDSVNNLLTAENFNATLNVKPLTAKISKAGSNFEMVADMSLSQGSSFGVNIDAISVKDDSNTYLKVTGLDNQFVAMGFGALIAGNGGLGSTSAIQAMNGVWYKASSDDLKGIGSEYACAFEYNKFLSNDGMKVIADAYKANAFFVPKEGAEVKEEDGKKIITVTVDQEKLKAFEEAVRKSDKYSVSESCKSYGESMTKDFKEGEATLKIDGSKLVGIKVKDNDVATIDYEKKDISAPSNAKSLADAIKEIKNGSSSSNGGLSGLSGLFGGLFGGNTGTDDGKDDGDDDNFDWGSDSDDDGDDFDWSSLFGGDSGSSSIDWSSLLGGSSSDFDDDGDDFDWSSLFGGSSSSIDWSSLFGE
ncbi:hypothetical protein J6X13_01245 [Candidatus Saccharibacteria bacterium]|nr:hypothetical protein [Candidatus Saccharibacteria bacterium]